MRGVKTTGKVQKYSDGSGLYLYVSPTGGKLWRMDYRFDDDKRKTLSFGAYPAVSLKDARARREKAKEHLAAWASRSAQEGRQTSVRAETENTFEEVAREWHAKYSHTWAESHSGKILARLVKDVFPILGGKLVNRISAPELLDVLRRIDAGPLKLRTAPCRHADKYSATP